MKTQIEDENTGDHTPGKAFRQNWEREFRTGGSRRSSSSSSRAFRVEENLVVNNSHLLEANNILKECS